MLRLFILKSSQPDLLLDHTNDSPDLILCSDGALILNWQTQFLQKT